MLTFCFTSQVSYANMIGDIADRSPGANKHDILNAVGSDSRVGKKYFPDPPLPHLLMTLGCRYLRPGYGFGGPCFPRDNRALGGYAKMIGVQPLLPEATDLYNKLHTSYQIDEQLALNKAEYVFTGIGYKDPCPVNIIEESQKLVIAQALARAGKRVVLRDRDFLIKARCARCCYCALPNTVCRQQSLSLENFSLTLSSLTVSRSSSPNPPKIAHHGKPINQLRSRRCGFFNHSRIRFSSHYI